MTEHGKPKFKIPCTVLLLVFVFALGAGLFLNLPVLQRGFLFADEATYYAMTESLVHDGDLEYTRKDLARYYQDFDSGPMGIFLKKKKDGKLYFAKSFAYSLFSAPFVKVFSYNGFLVFHSLLLLILMIMGYSFLTLKNGGSLSLGYVLTFFPASVAVVYFFWISPDFFNMVLMTAVLFLWIYKHSAGDDPHRRKTALHQYLLSDSSDYLAAFLAGIAVYTKPPNIILMLPLVLHALIRKKVLKALIVGVIFLITSGLFWGINNAVTGDWNYQGGERKIFYENYPLQQEGFTFDSLGWEMTSENYEQKHRLPIRVTLYNLFYYFFGRSTGLLWYFFPAVLGLWLFLRREKTLHSWLLFSALSLGILIYVVFMPDNYAGGGGALSNRYFLNIYPFFLFLPAVKRKAGDLVLMWGMAALFISPILVNPIHHSHFPDSHLKKMPFKALPIELSLVNNISTNTNPQAFKVRVGEPPGTGLIHHLDDNFYPIDQNKEIWTRGNFTAEMILETQYPIEFLMVHLVNNPRSSNVIRVKIGRKKASIRLGEHQYGKLTFHPGAAFQLGESYLYILKIKAEKGSIPFFEQNDSQDKSYRGVRFRLEITPGGSGR